MWFKKNNVDKAFKSFNFLIEYGFTLKRYHRAPDEERVYSQSNIVIEVDYFWGVYPDYTKNMRVDVIIKVDEYRNNLLESDKIFNAELLESLKTEINAVTPLEQIPIYADFIKTNINSLLQHKKD